MNIFIKNRYKKQSKTQMKTLIYSLRITYLSLILDTSKIKVII